LTLADPLQSGSPRLWLRLEGFAALAIAVLIYHRSGYSWRIFLLLFLVPDISFVGYAFGPRMGAFIYNLFHSYLIPAALGCALWLGGLSIAIPLIWVAHIGFDRLLGYGLKYSTAFADTHLGRIGRQSPEPANP
jgi:hypothetical protein